MHCLFRERKSEHRSVSDGVCPLTSPPLLSIPERQLAGTPRCLPWSTPTRGATTLPLLSMAQWTQSKSLLDTCPAILSTSLHWTTRYCLRSKYFYHYSLFIVQCVQRTTRILPVCVQASSLHLYNRWWLSIQYICTAGDCRIPRDTSCESVFKCVWPCLLPRVVYQQSQHTHNMIFTNA